MKELIEQIKMAKAQEIADVKEEMMLDGKSQAEIKKIVMSLEKEWDDYLKKTIIKNKK